MQKKLITVDVVSDIACPWCYIGKKRLESAIQQWEGAHIEVNFKPYILNPNIPKEGQNRKTYLEKKFGTAHRPDAMNRIENAGKDEGITLNFGDKWLGVDTFPLHKLLFVAEKEGFKTKLKERLFYAYFTENLHLNKPEILNQIMSEFGWDAEKTQQIITDDKISKKVEEEIIFYQNKGVTGVPFFIINDKYGVSGAQPSETFISIFNQVANEDILSTDGDSCGVDGDCPI